MRKAKEVSSIYSICKTCSAVFSQNSFSYKNRGKSGKGQLIMIKIPKCDRRPRNNSIPCSSFLLLRMYSVEACTICAMILQSSRGEERPAQNNASCVTLFFNLSLQGISEKHITSNVRRRWSMWAKRST